MRRPIAFTLLEVLVGVAVLAVLAIILVPSLRNAREHSKRLVCASNLKGIGTSAKIYAKQNKGRWMIPPHDRRLDLNWERIEYRKLVGKNRDQESTWTAEGSGKVSSEVSVTRAYWMLVRSGDITPPQFICPSSGDTADTMAQPDKFYDFTGYANLSYGYQVPFGPRDTRPRERMDNRQPVAADKGPFYKTGDTNWEPREAGGQPVNLGHPSSVWRAYNSPNHGGAGNGAGQNVLFGDGRVNFEGTPAVGIDHDNIYTLMEDNWGESDNFNLIHGLPPGSIDPAPFPGQEAFGPDMMDYASTDSLIYP